MGLELRQQLKLSQQLVMTPQLQQAIKLLQLSRLELMETVQREIEENPMLEELSLEEASGGPTIAEDAHAPDASTSDGAMERELLREAEWNDYLGEFSSLGRQAQLREVEMPDEGLSLEGRLSGKQSLSGHLSWQMQLSDFTERELCIGEVVLGNLDPAGYLQATLEEVAAMSGTEPAEVESVLRRIQRLDPVGVAARDPRECLLVQLEAYALDDPVLVALVSEHLDDLEKKRYKPLAKKFGLTMDELKEYLDVIQTLDPLPGSAYGGDEPVYVSPDAFVYKFAEDFIILLNEEGLPRLALSSLYDDALKGSAGKDKDYIQEKSRAAAWLIKSLHQRSRTLYKVLESIIRFQRDFFEVGVTKLKPLILKDVAEDIGMHESTVSRITSNKYVATPHGIFELKFFFNSALEMDDGSSVGSESVKAQIKQLIAEEDAKHPISDEQIADILKERLQINIARRTVAKYRTSLGIDSSSKRKSLF